MKVRKLIVLTQVIALLLASTLGSVQAAMLGTEQYIAGQDPRAAQIDRIQAALSEESLSRQLMAMGVSADAAMARVAALSDAELRELSGRLDTLPAGGDILALIGATFVVLLILEVTGVINIFK